MSGIGHLNSNWKGYGIQRLDLSAVDLTKKLSQLGTCGHEITTMPPYLVGKIDICYDCYCEQERAKQEHPDAGGYVSEPATVAETVSVTYGTSELGTHVIISGGEIMELDSYLESDYDERNGGDDLPF